ncbi:MAG: phytanoyl-CoA dioxygenase family protein [Bacteroidetes bacterium]|nr:phytanoyl-CoA dioxygenase family protein [Bacteroidota bacterium]
MITPDHTRQYKKDGYCLVKKYLDPSLLTEILNEARSIFDVQLRRNGISPGKNADLHSFELALFELFKKDYNGFLGSAKLVQHTLSMHRLAVSEKIDSALKKIGLSHPVICVKPIIFFNSKFLAKMEGHYKTPAHQDWRSMQGSLNSVVVWMPLVPIDKDLGAVEFVPGSHRHGLLESEKDDWYRHVNNAEITENSFVPAEVEPGDMVLFSAFLVHRSGNNITDRIRWSMHFRYNDVLDPSFAQRSFPHPYVIYRPEQEIITPGFPTKEDLDKTFS